MNDMRTHYEDEEYDNRRRGYRDYDYRYDRDDYRYDYRDYRDDYRRREDYRRGRRNYRDDYYEELEMAIDDMKETSRKLEDLSDEAKNMQEKNMLTKVAQKEKEHAMMLKQATGRGM